jgi:hypothetical protein
MQCSSAVEWEDHRHRYRHIDDELIPLLVGVWTVSSSLARKMMIVTAMTVQMLLMMTTMVVAQLLP